MSKWIALKINKRQETSVLAHLDHAHRDMVQKNRAYLRMIVESILFTAQQNIPQRGHPEDRYNIGQDSDVNRGNLIELLHLRCRVIPWLAERLTSQLATHQQWLSPNIQNEILNIASDLILKDISKAVGKTGKFSIIVDETTDVSNKEQVSVCLRCIHNGQPAETFVGFHEVKSAKGKALFQLVLDVLHKMELRIEDVVGQYYDGASNMSGKEKGVAIRVQEVAPKAIYVHCYEHLLNLALQDTLQENTVIRDALGVVQSIHNFFNTPKRGNVLCSVHMPDIDLTPYSPYIKLKSLSETRWSCRWESVKAVEQQPERILLALIELCKEKDDKTSVDAKGLVKAMPEFQFILGLHTLNVIFSNTNALARYLQGYDADVMTAKITCDATLETLKTCREEDMFSLIWEKARKTATNMIDIAPDIEEVGTKKRQKKPSKRLQAFSGETPEEPISFTDHQRARMP
ncbi:zinc finger MYM-type protein 1-like [Macrobrachium rosenbergii]|uniref:zinc finger MYM-type protein 1-like n=1 Tax=Macrobrachium rosenbergii TaxID=79674 RepID=UPI0034D5D70D